MKNLPPAPPWPGREFGHSLSIPKNVLLPTAAMEPEQRGERLALWDGVLITAGAVG